MWECCSDGSNNSNRMFEINPKAAKRSLVLWSASLTTLGVLSGFAWAVGATTISLCMLSMLLRTQHVEAPNSDAAEYLGIYACVLTYTRGGREP